MNAFFPPWRPAAPAVAARLVAAETRAAHPRRRPETRLRIQPLPGAVELRGLHLIEPLRHHAYGHSYRFHRPQRALT